MTSEEIRKLLGGYATNTLTESERKALFEAALDDQELFNALQEEETLKDTLADPVTRAQVRQALDQPASGRQRFGMVDALVGVGRCRERRGGGRGDVRSDSIEPGCDVEAARRRLRRRKERRRRQWPRRLSAANRAAGSAAAIA